VIKSGCVASTSLTESDDWLFGPSVRRAIFIDPVAKWFALRQEGNVEVAKALAPTPGSNRLMFNVHTHRGLRWPSWGRARNAHLSSINMALLAEGERLKLPASA
jgi:hypothetical protein